MNTKQRQDYMQDNTDVIRAAIGQLSTWTNASKQKKHAFVSAIGHYQYSEARVKESWAWFSAGWDARK